MSGSSSVGSLTGSRADGKTESKVSSPPVLDYEGSTYRQDFWEGQGREYEDAIERLVLERMLPPAGGVIAEIGAGFGRLASLYLGYEQIILFDYSRTLLQEARVRWGEDGRFHFVAGNIYDLPLADGVLDSLVMVRVMHHLADVPSALAHLQRTLHSESVAVLEYANKRNLKSILRWAVGRQSWSPFDPEPVEFVALNYDFHPDWMERNLRGAGFVPVERRGASHFRLPALKRRLSASFLARIENHFTALAGAIPLAPSVFVRAAIRRGQRLRVGGTGIGRLFRCVRCGASPLREHGPDSVACDGCGSRFRRSEGIWDFKEPDSST